jgi:hypothetical protein
MIYTAQDLRLKTYGMGANLELNVNLHLDSRFGLDLTEGLSERKASGKGISS